MPTSDWNCYCEKLWDHESLKIRLDLSRMPDIRPLMERMSPLIQKAFTEMVSLEAGGIANPDENRQVGHYWLRAPKLAPSSEQRASILNAIEQVKRFAKAVHRGDMKPPKAERFKHFLLLGIGGSALGPQWLYDALRSADTPIQAHFIDNTDPDGFDRTLDEIGDELNATLVIVTSKSGGTQETRNAMHEVDAAYRSRKLNFGQHAVVITGEGSNLYLHAQSIGMIDTFPIWDWVGGRTSLFSPVGLLPAALLGCDIDQLLAGAAAMDEVTRNQDASQNPAMLLALSWFAATNGRGDRAMVLLPYKDRLGLYGRYIQQLVMESLGKELDLESRVVNQGIAVYGNKGSTDQHALVQQLRDGPDDFFMTFIEVLKDRKGFAFAIEDNVTSGDHLLGFLLGTRQALTENQHMNLTITLPDVSPHSLGMLVAWFERAVSFYASLVGINAYHQPGVEAGKRAAAGYIQLQQQLLQVLSKDPSKSWDIPTLAQELHIQTQTDALFYLLEHLVANERLKHNGASVLTRKYRTWT